jgi:nicotinamidase/pyrazinamidase
MRARFPQFDGKTMAKWIDKFFGLWSRNQWKRERLAPALHVASRNLDPKTWRRSPILNGGFKEELHDMWTVANISADKAQPRHSALLLIDVQKGFGSKGELAVPDAEAIIPVINNLMEGFDLVVASQDWHPEDHCSFETDFPPHCVQNTPGAEFIDGLDIERIDRVFRKGTLKEVDSFSVFVDNVGNKATDIEQYLRERAVKEVYIAGLATDYCVFRSALDAVKAGFKTFVVLDACRGIDKPSGTVEQRLAEMREAGVVVVNSSDVKATAAL